MLRQIFCLLVGVFWAAVFCLRAIIDLVKLGPSKYFYVNRNAPVPQDISNEKYGEHRIISLGPVKLHCVISGPENAPLMLMLHGFPEIWYSWKHQIIEFQKEFRVVALNMRGFGDSEKPKGLKNYKLDVLVEDIKLLVEALEYKSCILMGHDWGGGVAWAFANKHPTMVDRLIIMNMCPVPLWYNAASSNLKQFLCSGYIFFFFLPFLADYSIPRNDVNFFRQIFNGSLTGLKSGPLSDDEIECFKHYYRRPGAFTPGINYYRANLWPPAFEHPLTYPMPVHIIWGADDPYLSQRLLDDTLKAVPHATLTKIENCSHWVQNDQPDTVAKAIREFLKSSDSDMTMRK